MFYRTDDPARWGVGKGSNLTPVEVDGNFWELAERLVAVEGAEAGSGLGITNIAVTGSQMTIFLEDGTALGPYTLPTAMIRYRGDWVPGAAYAELDLVAVPDDAIYLVLQDHDAAAVFDRDATGGDDNPLYRWLFPIGQSAPPTTFVELTDTPAAFGAAGTVATVNASGDGIEFVVPALGADAPADGQVYARQDGGWVTIDVTFDWADIQDKPATFPPDAHTHATADITGFAEGVDDRVAALLVAGTNITLIYDDAGGTLTIDAAGGGGGGGGAESFLDLADTPGAFGTAGQIAAVNATSDGIEFIDAPAAGLADAPADGNIYARFDGAWTAIDLPAPEGAYRYWRMRLTGEDNGGYQGNLWITEIQFRSVPGTAEAAGDSAGTVIRSGFNAGGVDTRAFDGTVSGSNYVAAAPPFTGQYLGYAFNEPKVVQEFTAYHNTTFASGPREFAVDASEDGVTWHEVLNVDRTSNATESWQIVPAATPVDWTDISGKPAAFTPATEDVQDIVGAMVVAGANVIVTYNDAAGTLTIDAGGGAGGGGGGVSDDFTAFKVSRTAGTQSVASGTATNLTYDTEVFDPDGLIDPAAGSFTVPVSLNGRWMEFTAGVRFTNTATTQIASITRDGSFIAGMSAGTGQLTVTTGPVQVATGQVFRASGFSSSATSHAADARSFFAGKVLSGISGVEEAPVDGNDYVRSDGAWVQAAGGGGGGSAFQGFRAAKDTNQAISTSAEVVWEVEAFDTEGAFAANRFTVPAGLDGSYMQFAAGSALSATSGHALQIRRSDDDGATWTEIAQSASTGLWAGNVGTGPVPVSTGQVFSVVVDISTAGPEDPGGGSGTLVADARTFFAGNVLG